MKAGKLAIWPWLSCPYNENTLVDLPSSVKGADYFSVNSPSKSLSRIDSPFTEELFCKSGFFFALPNTSKRLGVYIKKSNFSPKVFNPFDMKSDFHCK